MSDLFSSSGSSNRIIELKEDQIKEEPPSLLSNYLQQNQIEVDNARVRMNSNRKLYGENFMFKAKELYDAKDEGTKYLESNSVLHNYNQKL